MKKYIKYAIPCIMLFFFVRNLILVETDHLDSWMGGGMRMFGKIDKMLYRVSGINIKHNNKVYFVNLRDIKTLEDIYVESRIMPNDERLTEFIEQLKKFDWCYNAEADKIMFKEPTTIYDNTICTEPVNPENIVDMEVYRIDYNRESDMIQLNRINHVENNNH
ncbi:hypothetical protein F6U93_00635 [Tamlana haliotis]|uniref:Uncharacterized protein n=1 Tax=Pseudotamlana haliotis TaxID=2614804 RepID=A0A6N6MJD8_9FLAO|nr:hypothetical protein [Tamlana haliotis]KAB1071270.1 hypothetical protein F6U93_00635 [Tamlana haliotis]